MSRVIASHFTFACYGFWPPNDDRGSWSDTVWAEHLRPFGPAKTVSTRRSIAHHAHDREKNRAIREALLYPVVKLSPQQRRIVASAFEETVQILRLVVHACVIMPDHVHVVARRHERDVEEITGYLKRSGTRELSRARQHPLGAFPSEEGSIPTPWAIGGWKRFIFREEDIPGAIAYVMKNPDRIGEPRQDHSFVVPYPG